MRSRVELFEQIRRDREFEGLSIHALARRQGVHRRTVRQAVKSALPPPSLADCVAIGFVKPRSW